MQTLDPPTASTTHSLPTLNKPTIRKRRILGPLLLFALTIGIFLCLPRPASVQSRSDLIRLNVYATKCLQKRADDFNNGNIIHLWDCDVGPIGNKAFYYDPDTGY